MMNNCVKGAQIYICKKCGHRFERALPFGLFCPKCKSLNVEKDHFTVR